jgi:chorismate dehydratase
MTLTMDLKTLKVARLSYLNTIPFFMDGSLETALSASPKVLGDEAAEGRVDAGPFSLVDTWRLEKDFEPLGGFGIATKGPARSVILFSKCLPEDLDHARIGVTDETATSVRLLELILTLRDGVKPVLSRGFTDEDTARLLIGDQALLEAPTLRAAFPYAFDLGREWYLWRERPFVFAKWMVRKTVPAELKKELEDRLEASLTRFEKNPEQAVWRAMERVALPELQLRNYLSGFVYRLSDHERESEQVFRALCDGLYKKSSKKEPDARP